MIPDAAVVIGLLAIAVSVASSLLSAHAIITMRAIRYVYSHDTSYKDAPRWVRVGLWLHRRGPDA